MTTITKKTKKKVKPKLIQKMDDWEKPVPFDEGFKFPGGGVRITFEAKSFMNWIHECLPVTVGMPSIDYTQVKERGIAIGDNFHFYMRELPMVGMDVPDFGGYGMFSFLLTPRPTRSSLKIYRRTTAAYVAFSECVSIPVLCDKDLQPWMSLTPNEILTQRGQLRRAKGHTAIAGLGLGWMARKILQRKSVTKLTVIEKDQSVIDFFGKPLKDDFGDRIELVNADAYVVNWQTFDVSLWDIWEGYGNAQSDSKFQTIKRDLIKADKVCFGWGDNIYRD